MTASWQARRLALVLALAPTAYAQPDLLEVSMPLPAQATLPPPTRRGRRPAPPALAATSATIAPEAQPSASAARRARRRPPDPLAALDPADRPIAEKMRDLLTAKVDRIFPNRKERSTVDTFYQNRNLAPLWIEQGVVNARAKAVIERLRKAEADGLDLKDYKIPNFDAANPDALADAELKFTVTVLTFARHLQAGRFPYSRVGKDIEMPQAAARSGGRADHGRRRRRCRRKRSTSSARRMKATASSRPSSPSCAARPREEEQVRAHSGGPDGAPRHDDARMPLLRQRLNVIGEEDSLRYDNELVAAVKAFQKGKGVNADGMLGAGTVRLLNGVAPPRRADSVDTVIINMERWRWLPRDLGKINVMVNIPDYTLRVFKNGSLHWSTRIVVGKPNLQTPHAHRADEVHHRQPDLERAAVDHQQRIPAGAGAGSDRARPHGTEAGQ